MAGDPAALVEGLGTHRNIWIVGGNTVLAPLLERDMVDHLIIQVAPVLLGEGVPLFTQGGRCVASNLRRSANTASSSSRCIHAEAGCGTRALFNLLNFVQLVKVRHARRLPPARGVLCA